MLRGKVFSPLCYLLYIHLPPPDTVPHKVVTFTNQSFKMPKSKRAKVITLSRTEKKGKELTLRLFANVRDSIDRYGYCFVFSVENMRNTYLKDVRQEFSDSR